MHLYNEYNQPYMQARRDHQDVVTPISDLSDKLRHVTAFLFIADL